MESAHAARVIIGTKKQANVSDVGAIWSGVTASVDVSLERDWLCWMEDVYVLRVQNTGIEYVRVQKNKKYGERNVWRDVRMDR